jgi:peptide deformylase
VTVLPILHWPDARLKRRCIPVDVIDDGVRVLAQDMLDTMYAANGRGLAGPQVGVLRRIFVMDTGWKQGTPDPVVVVNPDILSMSDKRETGPEGCLSIPGVIADISRATELRMRWTDLGGHTVEQTLTGFAAICAQHEFDHLDGIVTFDRIPPEARAALLAEFGA